MTSKQTSPRPIRILSKELAIQIAAGEVIERPASILKELIENALDADARRINIKVKNGGCSLIRVVDDGWGIEAKDLLLALERHATSKVTSAEELTKITTMGFRGEALPSIAAVSKLTIRSRPRGAIIGNELKASSNFIHTLKEVGCPEGTLVEVADLFFNTPARKKFLKNQTIEASHLSQVYIRLALARPDVSLCYNNSRQTIYDLPATQNLAQRTAAILGRDIVEQMFLIEEYEGPLIVTGLLSQPNLTRPTPNQIYIFVNGRFIRNRLLLAGITKVYRHLLSSDRRPIAVLHINLDPEIVDVNVHPTKTEIRFRYSQEVYQALIVALRQALAKAQPALPISQFESISDLIPQAIPSNWTPTPSKQHQFFISDKIKHKWTSNTKPHFPKFLFQSNKQLAIQSNHNHLATSVISQALQPLFGPAKELTIIGQLHELYILCSAPKALIIVDQHAAHERLNYEMLRCQQQKGNLPRQKLLSPINIELSPQELVWAYSQRVAWNRLGLEISPFGGHTWIITALPIFLKIHDPVTLVHDLLSEINATETLPNTPEFLEAGLRSLACHMSLKQGQKLSLVEMEKLINKTVTLPPPVTCPHGRPVFLYLSSRKLAYYFQRNNKNE